MTQWPALTYSPLLQRLVDLAHTHLDVGYTRDQADQAIEDHISTWTVAQLFAWLRLANRDSGITPVQLINRTSGGVMPGIGGAINGDVGTIGVNDFNGIFIGIEPDGYTHS